VGTELFRKRLPELLPSTRGIWCKSMNCWLDSQSESKRIVIPDVRFHDEAECIIRRGGVIIRIIRNSIVSSDMHESERTHLSIPTHYLIENNGTLMDLERNVRELVELELDPID
jgi:hypothetical protein